MHPDGKIDVIYSMYLPLGVNFIRSRWGCGNKVLVSANNWAPIFKGGVQVDRLIARFLRLVHSKTTASHGKYRLYIQGDIPLGMPPCIYQTVVRPWGYAAETSALGTGYTKLLRVCLRFLKLPHCVRYAIWAWWRGLSQIHVTDINVFCDLWNISNVAIAKYVACPCFRILWDR